MKRFKKNIDERIRLRDELVEKVNTLSSFKKASKRRFQKKYKSSINNLRYQLSNLSQSLDMSLDEEY